MPSVPPYFRSLFPEKANEIDQGYSEMAVVMANFAKGILRRFNPFRIP